MDAPAPQTSFIPHDTGAGSGTTYRYSASGGLGELLLLLSIVAFIASGALAGGVFMYDQYLKSQNDSKTASLKRAEAQIDTTTLGNITKLDDRLQAASAVLAAHTAPVALLNALDQTTLTTVSFQTFHYDASDASHPTVQMSGVARSVNSIALQADLFSKSNVLSNPIFSGIDRQPDGVHFSLLMDVNPASILYAPTADNTANSATQAGQGSASVQPQQVQSQPTATPGPAQGSQGAAPANQTQPAVPTPSAH